MMSSEAAWELAKTLHAPGITMDSVKLLERSTLTDPTVDGLPMLARWKPESTEGRTDINQIISNARELLVVSYSETRGKFEYRLARLTDAEQDLRVDLHNINGILTDDAAEELFPDWTESACELLAHNVSAFLLSSRYDIHSLLRAVSIWFHFEAVTQVQAAAANMLWGLMTIPSAKVIPLIPLLTACLCDQIAVPETVETTTNTLVRLAIEHPHHTHLTLVTLSDSQWVRQGGPTPPRIFEEILQLVDSSRNNDGVVGDYKRFIRAVNWLLSRRVLPGTTSIRVPRFLQRTFRNVCVLTHVAPVDPRRQRHGRSARRSVRGRGKGPRHCAKHVAAGVLEAMGCGTSRLFKELTSGRSVVSSSSLNMSTRSLAGARSLSTAMSGPMPSSRWAT